ncbi:cytochrome b [Vibrio sp. SM6]|uniref:Cytochrome b n=1 Tax=Vibrio agarilyticus TaxID=2726741 RepID=A0A7X8TRI6_9VIBR|nr:cytochrome b [Vibrio agarilyticus]NLS13429.1 cytochrome b [Vibrio agarilyticus]
MQQDNPHHYHGIAKSLHWLSALAVFSLFGLGLWMMDLSYYSQWYQIAPNWHRSIGILLAIATLMRLVCKWMLPSPAIEGALFEKRLAISAHHLMYLLLGVMFVSGYLISTSDGRPIQVFNWFSVPSLGELFDNQSDIAGAIHFYAAWSLIGLASLHALAALKHHFINKDNTLRKMTGVLK